MSTNPTARGRRWLLLLPVALAGMLSLAGASPAMVRTAPAAAQAGQLVVSAGGPYAGVVGQPIVFTAQAFLGGVPVTTGVQFQWNLGDGRTGFGQTITHTYATAGTYTVTVFAQAATGQTGFAGTIAQISGAPTGQLTVSAGGPYVGQVGVAILFTAQATIGGAPPTVLVNFSWSFGDGTGGFGQTVSHAYSAAGTYIVSVTATTATGQVATASTTAQIGGGQAFQVSAGGPYTAAPGQPVTLTGSVSGLPVGVTFQFLWMLGDGATGVGQTITHTYAAAGTYTVTLTVTASTGQVASATTTVTVGGVAIGGTEQINLFPACNNVAVTWPNSTAIAVVAAAISPSTALVAIWRFDNATQRFMGWSPLPGAPNDLLTVNRADPVFICMNRSGTLSRPVI